MKNTKNTKNNSRVCALDRREIERLSLVALDCQIERLNRELKEVQVATTHVIVFNKNELLYDGDNTTDVKLVYEGDLWVKISQGEKGFIEINFDEWPALQAAVELIIKNAPIK